jgi:hypothetical protein
MRRKSQEKREKKRKPEKKTNARDVKRCHETSDAR